MLKKYLIKTQNWLKKTFYQKIVNFLYFKSQLIKGKVIYLHQKLIQMNESGLTKEYDRNPYEMLRDWSLDVLYHGTLLSITLTLFTTFTFTKALTLIIPLGIARYVFMNIIRDVRNNIR